MDYEVIKELTSFRDVVTAVKEDENALLFLGTGGWHGSNRTLKDVERILRGEDEVWLPEGAYVTVFIFNPEKVYLRWGEIHVRTLNESDYLRGKVQESLKKAVENQKENL